MTRILLVRHGESEGNADASAYVDKGDNFVSLTDKGWEQAIRSGAFLQEFYRQTKTTQWPTLFLSPFQRTQETLSGLLHGMAAHPFEGPAPRLHEDPRLIEQSFGALAHMRHADSKHNTAALSLHHFSRAVRKGNPYAARPPFGESPKDLVLNVKSFIDGTLSRDFAEGQEDFLIIAHGAVIRAFISAWFHLPMNSWKQLENPGNTDVFNIEGTPKNWTVRKIYDGERGEETDINPIADIKRLTADNLPQPPHHVIGK